MCEMSAMKRILFWPEWDCYFGAGVTAFKTLLDENERYLFVNLSRVSLIPFINDFRVNKFKERVVIISSGELLPLASWLHEVNSNICGVFSSDISVVELLWQLSNKNRRASPAIPRSRKISHRDVLLLRNALNGGDIYLMQHFFGCSRATLYRWRSDVAKKLGCSRLKQLAL